MATTVATASSGSPARSRSRKASSSSGNSQRPGVFARRVAPWAPVALGLLGQATLNPPTAKPTDFKAAVCGPSISGYEECHNEYPTGCSKAAKYDAYLNELKNLPVAPAEPVRWLAELKDFTGLDQKLPHDLTRDNQSQLFSALKGLGEGSVAGTVGYLYYAQKGGTSESSNCQLSGTDNIDFHLGIGFDPALAAKLAAKQPLTESEKSTEKKESIIVEMTPHWRARFKPDWSLDLLKPAIGHQVRVIGQLLIDNEHYDTKDNCAIKGANQETCWRASVWELHPVTGFQVCGTGDNCARDGAGWVELEDYKGTPAGSS
ncbi:MAG TPA: hypothetical protein VGM86_35640 [Thermoanaerobaculia bacterium]